MTLTMSSWRLSMLGVAAVACQAPVVEAGRGAATRVESAASSRTSAPDPAGSESASDATGSGAISETPYPPGAWRRAQRGELLDVLLWVSHILIRHQSVAPREVPFTKVGWYSMPPPPRRPRQQALVLARQIADLARTNPGVFARLASEYSEDDSSRDRGGSLGGISALRLIQWPQVLDALQALQPGCVSRVVETEYGFHILLYRPPPEPAVVSGSRIVIGHQRAQFLSVLRGEPRSARSREEAQQLAETLYARAVEDASRFSELVSGWSEHPDALLGGDIGESSLRELSDYPVQVEVLSELEVGQVAPPLETLFGWEVLLRTANRKREIYAMNRIELPFDIEISSAPTAASSEQKVLYEAQQLARTLRIAPEKFDELRSQRCCAATLQWQQGKGLPELMAVLKELRPGEIASEPIRFGFSYIIAKRVDAQRSEVARLRFELPAPDTGG